MGKEKRCRICVYTQITTLNCIGQKEKKSMETTTSDARAVNEKRHGLDLLTVAMDGLW
ncbi:MAG: hypothetical protein ACI3ZD_00535 [Prevotella sp.]